jgi:hypothetical protein
MGETAELCGPALLPTLGEPTSAERRPRPSQYAKYARRSLGRKIAGAASATGTTLRSRTARGRFALGPGSPPPTAAKQPPTNRQPTIYPPPSHHPLVGPWTRRDLEAYQSLGIALLLPNRVSPAPCNSTTSTSRAL